MTDISELDAKVSRFLENKSKRLDNLTTEIIDKIDDKPEQPNEAELEAKSPEKTAEKPNKKQKKPEKHKKKQEKKQSAKAVLLKELIAKIKKYKHPVDIKTLSNMSMKKISAYALFIDEFYNNKPRTQPQPQEESPVIIKNKPKKPQTEKPPMQLILKKDGNEYYYTLYE